MNTDTLIYGALGAMLIFWAVGAHNRLVRLKNAVGKAYAPVDELLRQRQDLLAQLSQLPLGQPIQSTLSELCRQELLALDQLRAKTSGAPELGALEAAENALDDCLASLWQVPEVQVIVRSSAPARQLLLGLTQLDSRLELAVAPYEQAAEAFNEAAVEFPAWLVARLSGLKPLPPLPLLQHPRAGKAAAPLMVGRRESDLMASEPLI